MRILLAFLLLATPALAQDDRGFLQGLLEDNLSTSGREVRIEGFSGALSSRAEFEKLTIADDDGIWLTLTDGAMAWNRSALAKGALEIGELSAKTLDMPRLPLPDETVSAEAKPFALPDLPVSVTVEKLAVAEISLGAPVLGEAVTAQASGKLQLGGGAGSVALKAERSNATKGLLSLNASYAPDSKLISLDILFDEGEGGLVAKKLSIPQAPAMRLAVAGAGPVDALALGLKLSTAGQERLAGRLTVQKAAGDTGFALQLAGDMSEMLTPQARPFFGTQTELALVGAQTAQAIKLDQITLKTAAMDLSGMAVVTAGVPEKFDITGKISGGTAGVMLPFGEGLALQKADLRLTHDRARSERWQLDAQVAGLKQGQTRVESLALQGSGRLRAGAEPSFGGWVSAQAKGLTLQDKRLQTALGDALAMKGLLLWSKGQPLRLAQLSAGARSLHVTGQLALEQGGALSVDLAAQQTDLKLLSGFMAGASGQAQAKLKGDYTPLSGAFDGQMQAQASALHLGQAAAQSALGTAPQLTLDARRDATGLMLRRLALVGSGLQIEGQGRLAKGQNDLTLALTAKTLSAFALGPQSQARATITAKGDALSLSAEASGLAPRQATLAAIIGNRLILQAKATQIPRGFALSSAKLDSGRLHVTAQGQSVKAQQDYLFALKLDDIAALAKGLTGALALEGKLTGKAQKLALQAQLRGPANTNAAISGSLNTALTALDLRATGQAALALANGFIEPQSAQGALGFDLALKGAPRLQNLAGQLTINKARLVAPTMKLVFEDGSGTVRLRDGTATIAAQTRLDTGGTLALNGPISLTAPHQSRLAITLDRLRLRDPELYETLISGELSLAGALAQSARLSGALALEQTELRIPSGGGVALHALPEVTHSAESAGARETRRKAGLLAEKAQAGATGPVLALDVSIAAPKAIFVRGRGIDAELGGALRLTGTTANVRPQGEFGLMRGRLDLLGKRFNLSEGTIALQGALVPWLRFVAQSSASDLQTQIVLEGAADAPQIAFTSSPELPQEEVLARILFGREVSSLSALQAAQLASAVATLAGKGGLGVISKLRQSTGLDDLDVATDEAGNTELTVGKYISDKAYTDVSVDSAGTSEIHLNLDLDHGLTARGSVGSDGNSGLGMFYEKDY